MIEIISPAGFEHFFRELAEMLADGPPPSEEGERHPDRPLSLGTWPAGKSDRGPSLGPIHGGGSTCSGAEVTRPDPSPVAMI
jgi:hypothetical protein